PSRLSPPLPTRATCTLPLHDALPILRRHGSRLSAGAAEKDPGRTSSASEIAGGRMRQPTEQDTLPFRLGHRMIYHRSEWSGWGTGRNGKSSSPLPPSRQRSEGSTLGESH